MLVTKRTISYPRGTIENLLVAAYQALHQQYPECEKENRESFHYADNLFYDNPKIGDKYAFITEYEGKTCGMCGWNPLGFPTAIIGHNCILPEFRGKGLGKEQLRVALRQIKENNFARAEVSTGLIDFFMPARNMYEAIGFKEVKCDDLETAKNKILAKIYYVLYLK
ncbi:MAG: GNAT family N-acetyltransferase [Lentisphaeria bacterium]